MRDADAETALAATARVYTRGGWSVFPLWWVDGGCCACPAGAGCPSPGKHPLTRQGVHEASGDAATVVGWWTRWPRANIGLPAGENGLAVVDVDPRHGGDLSLARLVGLLMDLGASLPATLTQATGGGGLHLVFAAPAGGVKGAAKAFGADLPGLDTRGRGGYIVAAPSMHASGDVYRWLDWATDPAPWPDGLSLLMGGMAAPFEGRSTRFTTVPGGVEPVERFLAGMDGYAAVALRGEVARVEAAAEGERNHTLNRAAFSLGQLVAVGLLDAERVADELTEAAAACGLTGREVAMTIRSGLRGGARRPRGED